METKTEELYLHLNTEVGGKISESSKLVVNTSETIAELCKRIYNYLHERNDGNKVYKISQISNKLTGSALPVNRYVSSFFDPTGKRSSGVSFTLKTRN